MSSTISEKSLQKPSLVAACKEILLVSDAMTKVKCARKCARDWRAGKLSIGNAADAQSMPDQPYFLDKPILLPPQQMPKLGRAGNEKNRIAMIHSFAHIEYAAIDLAFDLVGRFAHLFPPEFVDDWIMVGADEAMHFAILERRLRQYESFYGEYPAHGSLWDAAYRTRHDVAARLAVVPMVLEARGLDVTPATVKRFEQNGDVKTAKILNRIYHDEIRHVGAGAKWFAFTANLHFNQCGESHDEYWKRLVKTYFKGGLKPPFNDSARQKAGLSRECYHALAKA
ncbi:rhamnosyltransferase [Sphingorhabdus lutea]|uniref:Rhamnosyltransferase n=1 Tax=Sphingorhabdus lutea TaxID=1913578 RepID=A0A1L3J9I5_9SPHN|nr:ferritin-like domain-containing protein [Sphingorhabdus lutea]APG61771.1 rhamnosyltransferase [Sphingorhabdus lutea]